eukprot:1903442-Rhodomonas_salina.1
MLLRTALYDATHCSVCCYALLCMLLRTALYSATNCSVCYYGSPRMVLRANTQGKARRNPTHSPYSLYEARRLMELIRAAGGGVCDSEFGSEPEANATREVRAKSMPFASRSGTNYAESLAPVRAPRRFPPSLLPLSLPPQPGTKLATALPDHVHSALGHDGSRPLSPYAFDTPCPVLIWRMLLWQPVVPWY